MKEEGIVVSCLSRLMFYSRKDFGIPGNEGHRGFLLDGSSWRSEISVGLGWCRYFPERQKIRNSAQLSWSVFYICCAPWGLLSLTFPLEILWGFYQNVKCTSDQASRKSTFSWRLSLLFFVGMRLLYNVVLVSAVPWSESAMRIHIPPPSPRGHHRAWGKLPVLSRSFQPAVFMYLFDCGFHILQRSLPWSPFRRKQAYFCLWLSDLRGYLHFSLS